ncbi:MAG: cytochrome c biogenesis protein CcsA, partial [Bacteroidia bacterium]
ENWKATEVVLQSGPHQWRSNRLSSLQKGQISASFHPNNSQPESAFNRLYSVFVHLENDSQGTWMGLPDAVWLDLSTRSSDSVSTTVAQSAKEEGDRFSGLPHRPILNESIRNQFFHVPMWFAMMFLLLFSAVYAVLYLIKGQMDDDTRADAFIRAALVAGVIGCVTGAVWARATWGDWWPRDPKLNGVALGMLMYFAYLLLRSTLKDPLQRARLSSVYGIFVFPLFIALIWIMPKLSSNTLHPGSGGTVGFKKYDLDDTLKMIFYPAVIGWILVYTWIAQLVYRTKKLEQSQEQDHA